MSDRPDLASVRKIAALELEAQSRDMVLVLCDYAAALETELEGESVDSGAATAPSAIGLARTVLGHINDWATMDPKAEPFGWIANETAAALRALEQS